MSRRSRTPFVILGLLAHGPKTGYELKATIEGSVGHFWHESYGQLYPALKDLHARELVTMAQDADGGRARKTYAITKTGNQEFFNWLAQPPQANPVRNETLLKVFMASLGGPEDLRPHLEMARDGATARLETLRALHAQVSLEDATDHRRRCWLLPMDLGIRGAEATVAWAEQALAELGAIDEH